MTSTQYLIAFYIRSSGAENIITHLAFQHNNGSFFIHCYTKTEKISSMLGHNDQHPDNPLVKTSHSGIAVHSSLLIFLFKKQFPSLGFLPCIQCLRFLPCLEHPHNTFQKKSLVNPKPYQRIRLQPTVWNPELMSRDPLPVNNTLNSAICVITFEPTALVMKW